MPRGLCVMPDNLCVHKTHYKICAVCGLKVPKLSEVQVKILKLLACGAEQKEIASILGFARASIGWQIRRIAKLFQMDGHPWTPALLVVQAHRLRVINLDKEDYWEPWILRMTEA